MTTQDEWFREERTELIQRAYQLTGDLLRTEKTLYGLKQAQVGIGITLVNRFGMSISEAATISGMTRQRLSVELRNRDLRGDSEVTE